MKHFLTIQEHDAKRAGLHWDLRISYETGPSDQASWVIPKHHLPAPGDKLLAISVDDHPWEYRDYEGYLKDGYGSGSVKLIHADWTECELVSESKVRFQYNGRNYSLSYWKDNKWFLTCRSEKPKVKFNLRKK